MKCPYPTTFDAAAHWCLPPTQNTGCVAGALRSDAAFDALLSPDKDTTTVYDAHCEAKLDTNRVCDAHMTLQLSNPIDSRRVRCPSDGVAYDVRAFASKCTELCPRGQTLCPQNVRCMTDDTIDRDCKSATCSSSGEWLCPADGKCYAPSAFARACSSVCPSGQQFCPDTHSCMEQDAFHSHCGEAHRTGNRTCTLTNTQGLMYDPHAKFACYATSSAGTAVGLECRPGENTQKRCANALDCPAGNACSDGICIPSVDT